MKEDPTHLLCVWEPLYKVDITFRIVSKYCGVRMKTLAVAPEDFRKSRALPSGKSNRSNSEGGK